MSTASIPVAVADRSAFNTNDIVLHSFTPGENATTGSWNESTTLVHDLQDALLNTWDASDDAEDLALDGHLRLFADQIDSKAEELALAASIVLAEFQLRSPPEIVPFLDRLDDVAMLGDLSNVGGSHEASITSASSSDGSSWLEDIHHEVSVIESWEVEAQKLTEIAVAAFQHLKSDTTSIMENATRDAVSVLETNADELYRERQALHAQTRREHMQYVDPLLAKNETWEAGGYQVEDAIPPEAALQTITALALKRYKLRDDTQRDLGVSKGERRTRYHVGVIDAGDGTERLDPAAIFSYNIGAVSQLASTLDRLSSKLAASASFFQRQSALEDKISRLKTHTEDWNSTTFKSPSQLASEVAALETEAALTRISRLSQAVIQATRVNLMQSRFLSRLKLDLLNGQSSETVGTVKRESATARDIHAEDTEAYADQLLIHLEGIDKMKATWNSTKRELLEMEEEAVVESHVAKEEIHAEAAVEREDEAASLERIQLAGKARLDTVIHSIEHVFWHLAGSLKHIVSTAEGRRQFIFYCGSAALLVFAASTIKEMIALACIVVLRFFTAPRLVREYGNLGAQPKWPSNNTEAAKDIVLPAHIQLRMDVIVRVASAASKRRFPLRSVLIHGRPGCGKSMVAKALAKSIPDLPYALMSGADVFPMGSQGPAELRRLLTWANTRRHGGIVIIDEAESALGSRWKTRSESKASEKGLDADSSSSSGFSRDCLNVLLSMTGSFGKIMLILTTSNPSDLDEAVLDRMDEIIHLPLPAEQERRVLLRNEFTRKFKPTEVEQPSMLTHLMAKMRRRDKRACFGSQFDAEKCVSDLANVSLGCSGRELEKIIQGVLYKTYASDKGVLDRALWEKETKMLLTSTVNKHKLK